MGVFGVKIYEDDLALDVKEGYLDKLKKGIKDEVALKEIIKEYKDYINDIDDGPVFWIALANTMWKVGRLTEKVKKEALNAIDKNLIKWKRETDEKEYKLREKELLKFKDKINKEMPKIKIYAENKKKLAKKNENKKYQWNIGDVYAYKLDNEKAKELNLNGKYLIFRKIEDGLNKGRSIAIITYVQITNDEQLPKSKKDLEELPYIVISNMGNVRHEYRIELVNISQKFIKDELIYLGNYLETQLPKDEYIVSNKMNIPWYKINQIDFLLHDYKILGTNKEPVYYEVDPRDIEDSKIRFLMRARYYEEKLNITPPEGSIVKDDPLLYIALVDSMMIGGIVLNPVGSLTDEMKQEAYKRIEILKNIIKEREDKTKEEKLKILDELKTKIENFDSNDLFHFNF